jgi:hypothetical protein
MTQHKFQVQHLALNFDNWINTETHEKMSSKYPNAKYLATSEDLYPAYADIYYPQPITFSLDYISKLKAKYSQEAIEELLVAIIFNKPLKNLSSYKQFLEDTVLVTVGKEIVVSPFLFKHGFVRRELLENFYKEP